LAPVPPTFYSVSQLGDHLHSVRWELAIIGAGLAVVGLRDWDWGGSEFQFIEEGWFAKNTRHGGMDKIGHAFSTYVIADILTDRIRENATNPTGAPITGALIAFGIMGLGEAVDGFTGKHRFSREDIVANGIGAAFSILRNSIPACVTSLTGGSCTRLQALSGPALQHRRNPASFLPTSANATSWP
jgi:hypothetical protein